MNEVEEGRQDESTPLTGPSLDVKDVTLPSQRKRRVGVALVSLLVVAIVAVLWKPFRFGLADNYAIDDNNSDNWLPAVGNYSLPITTSFQTDSPALALTLQRLFDNGLMNCYGFAERQATQVAQQAVQLVEQHQKDDNKDGQSPSIPAASLAVCGPCNPATC